MIMIEEYIYINNKWFGCKPNVDDVIDTINWCDVSVSICHVGIYEYIENKLNIEKNREQYNKIESHT